MEEELQLNSFEPLEAAERSDCPKCQRKRRFFCYDCCIALTPDVPELELPINVHVLKCKKEPRSKSSAVCIKVLAPSTSEVIDCLGGDGSVPQYADHTFLVFPGEESREIKDLTDDELANLKTAVFIDSTWRQTHSMLQDPTLQSLPMVKLTARKTLFWRYQQESDDNLSTIEAIYYFLVDLLNEKKNRGMNQEYAGQFDNLLWYFVFNYRLIQKEYTEKRHKGKRFRRMPDYINREDK